MPTSATTRQEGGIGAARAGDSLDALGIHLRHQRVGEHLRHDRPGKRHVACPTPRLDNNKIEETAHV
jgi:hypothetical protein